MSPHSPFPSMVAPLPRLSNGHSSPGPSSTIALHQLPSSELSSAPPSPASPPLAFSANDLLLAQIPSQRSEVSSSSQHPRKKSCPVQGCQQLIAPTMWRQHMTLHAQGFFSGAVPGPWLQTCLFVLIASSWWLIHTIPLTFGNAHTLNSTSYSVPFPCSRGRLSCSPAHI